MRCLQGTLTHVLLICQSNVDRLISYSDADQAICPTTRWSTSDFCVYLVDNLVSWFSKWQHVVSRSSAEAEYLGVTNMVAETAWLRNLLLELSCQCSCAIVVFYDNVNATYLVSNPIQHQITKHVEFDLHFVRERVLRLVMCVFRMSFPLISMHISSQRVHLLSYFLILEIV